MTVQLDALERRWNKLTPAGFSAPTRETAMIAALGTLAFLVTLWLLVQVAATTLDESGGKIVAALKGRSPLATAPIAQPISWKFSPRVRAKQPLRARPTLRAAA